MPESHLPLLNVEEIIKQLGLHLQQIKSKCSQKDSSQEVLGSENIEKQLTGHGGGMFSIKCLHMP